MMTTFAEKMLAKAIQLEEQAAALRVAAEVMNGQALSAKHVAMASTVIAAHKVRRQQSPSNGNGHAFDGATPEERKARVQAMILHFLKDGPQRSEDVRAYLKSQGYDRGNARVLQLMKETPGLQLSGHSTLSRWQLAPEPSSQPERHEVPEKLTPWAATKARRADKAERILHILQMHGGPMKLRQLKAEAAAAGIDSLTGLHGLVLKGLLTARGTGVKRTYRLAT